MSSSSTVTQTAPLTVGLFPWGDLIEDFLDTIDISFEDFCRDMTGGWLFGYVEALKGEGIQTVIFCFSAQVDQPTYHSHKPTGATICVLPSTALHRWLRGLMINPYGWSVLDCFGPRAWWRRPGFQLLKAIAPYVVHPLVLLGQEVKQAGCDLLLCQEYEYPRFDVCLGLGKRLGLPVYATFQGGDFQVSWLEQWIRPHTLGACAGLVVASHREIERLHQTYRLDRQPVAQIFNPLDLTSTQVPEGDNPGDLRRQVRAQLGIPQSAVVVVYHGRMELYRKGLDLLLEAWRQLSADDPPSPWWLLLVGTGSDASVLGDRIDALPKANVCWVNEYILDRPRLYRYLRAADLYTLPSRHEGFPVAPLEAMACGLPVVATDVPGIPEILGAGDTPGGIMVPRNDPQALAQSLRQLLEDPVKRRQLGIAARHTVEQSFSLAAVGQQLRVFFDPGHSSP